MRALPILSALIAVLLGGCSYAESEMWRRSVCEDVVDPGERERCLEQATRSEGDYERDVEEALEPPDPES